MLAAGDIQGLTVAADTDVLVEGASVLASLGVDMACGFLHVDEPGRDSLVYDLMECERGGVDGLVLDFLTRMTLHYGDVTPVSYGSCRLHPQLSRAVVAACRVPRERINGDAHWLWGLLLHPLEVPDEAVAACASGSGGVGNAGHASNIVRHTGE